MPMQRHKIFITLILILAFLLRFYRLNTYPLLNPDEAAIGYNAYSLFQTGKDEHGQSWPIHFKSFSDYKPGAYFYLALPSVKLFGLTPLAVRLPNVIFSIISIYFLYLLVLLHSKNYSLALFSSLILTLSPWHIHFSRGAWESCTALSFLIIGTYYFYSKKYLLFVILFLASLYTYHSARIIAPLLALSFLVTNYRFLLTDYKKLLYPVLLGILLTIPVLFSFLNNGGTTRFGGVGLTADQGPLWRSDELLNQHQPLTLFARIIHNKRLLYFLSWAQKYASHFDFNFLFLNGDEVPRSKVPDMGQLYLIELPLIIIGIFLILHNTCYQSLKSLVLPWLFISPIASSLTFQAPSALRALSMSVPFAVLTAVGLIFIIKHFPKIVLILLLFFYFINFIYYLDAYYVHYPQRFPDAWSAPFNLLIPILQQYPNLPVYITDKYDQPYILTLFYLHYLPSLIQSEIQLTPPDKFGFSTVSHFDRFYFQKILWEQIPLGSLVISSDETLPAEPAKIINFPSGFSAFKIYLK